MFPLHPLQVFLLLFEVLQLFLQAGGALSQLIHLVLKLNGYDSTKACSLLHQPQLIIFFHQHLSQALNYLMLLVAIIRLLTIPQVVALLLCLLGQKIIYSQRLLPQALLQESVLVGDDFTVFTLLRFFHLLKTYFI